MLCTLENSHGLPLGQDARLYGSPEGAQRAAATVEGWPATFTARAPGRSVAVAWADRRFARANIANQIGQEQPV